MPEAFYWFLIHLWRLQQPLLPRPPNRHRAIAQQSRWDFATVAMTSSRRGCIPPPDFSGWNLHEITAAVCGFHSAISLVSSVWSSPPDSTRQTQSWSASSAPGSMLQPPPSFGQLGKESHDFGTAHNPGHRSPSLRSGVAAAATPGPGAAQTPGGLGCGTVRPHFQLSIKPGPSHRFDTPSPLHPIASYYHSQRVPVPPDPCDTKCLT